LISQGKTMDNLSTASSTDISSLIGALELGDHPTSHSDGAVEAAGANAMANPPTHVFVGTGCRGIDDGTLEAAAASAMEGPPTGQPWTGFCCGR
jgi:hypothetical protein